MRSVLSALIPAFIFTAAAEAQFIPIKTVPVAAGDQFLLFPSQRIGMGGVGIALSDPTADLFENPSMGYRLDGTRLFASPTFYGISQGNGGARSLPLMVLAGNGEWFGGAAVALQQLEAGQRFGGVFIEPALIDPFFPREQRLSDRSSNNMYAFGLLGRRLPSGVSVGASAFVADLSGMDGVELLYALADGIDQSGYLADLRAGVTAELSGNRELEVVGLYSRLRMAHDVSYLEWVVVDSTLWQVEPRMRLENNLDYTDTWGLHLNYQQPLASGWRIGGILTGNRKSHPKIPNYEIQNIPRDPGTSWAYNVGVGLASMDGPTTFGFDIILEPIRSHTWADAAEPTPTAAGGTIPIGAKTVDNQFRFTNALVRLGLSQEVDIATFQLGLQVRGISYTLRQRDLVAGTSRRQSEQWMEWTPTWGASVRLDDLELRYVGRVTTGTGRPGVAWDGGARESLAAAQAADILLAPQGPLTLADARVLTHQISVSLPIR